MRFSMGIGLILVGQVLASAHAGDVDAAIERALPFLEKEGTWWMEEKKCVSCHHSAFFVWAKDLALDAGMEVDEVTLSEQRKWVWDFFLAPKEVDEKAEKIEDPKVKGEGNVEGISQLLFSPSSRHVPTEVKASLLEIIRSNRTKDGDWKPGGQLPRQKRPAEETKSISYQWALAAMPTETDSKDGSAGENSKLIAKTNEWYAMNLVLNSTPEAIEQLLARQNEDGGWSWIDGEPSDPTGTGQALLALGRSGQAKEFPEVVDRARKYLTESQAEDGRWDTMSTKDREESTRISDFWGSAWAVIGLLEVRE